MLGAGVFALIQTVVIREDSGVLFDDFPQHRDVPRAERPHHSSFITIVHSIIIMMTDSCGIGSSEVSKGFGASAFDSWAVDTKYRE